VETVPFNPMEAMGTPEALAITEPSGSPRPAITGASEGTRGSPAPISPVFDPQWNIPGELPDGETIVVDTGALRASEGSESGDEQPEPPIAGDVRRSQRLHQAHAATTGPPIPKTYKEAINDPIYGAHWKQAISEELTKLQALNTWKQVPLPLGKKAIGYK